MAFQVENLNRTSSGMNTESITEWSYLTTDTGITIHSNLNYFGPAGIKFHVNDLINVVANSAGNPQRLTYRVDTTGASTVEVSLVERLLFYNMYISRPFFDLTGPSEEIFFALDDVFVNESWDFYEIIGVQYTFTLATTPTVVEIIPLINGVPQESFFLGGGPNLLNTFTFTTPLPLVSSNRFGISLGTGISNHYNTMNLNLSLQPKISTF